MTQSTYTTCKFGVKIITFSLRKVIVKISG